MDKPNPSRFRVLRLCAELGDRVQNLARRTEGVMKAHKGDRIVIRGHRVGEASRDCEVLEAQGADGGPPYLVRWEDSDHESLFFPGADATVEHFDTV